MRLAFFVATLLLSLSSFGQKKDISWDINTGNKVAIQVEKSIGLIRLADAEKAVKAVGDRLVSQLDSNPFTFSFQIVDQLEPNAFALPGGHVYVSRGLLVLLRNEDELAGVLGHEISHVIQRHSAKQQQKAIVPTILAVPGILLGNTLGGDLGERVAAPLLGAGRIMIASYGRKQETEADELGVSLAAKAGYDPNRLSDILHRIELWVQSETGKASKFSLLNDHPLTPEREKNIAEKTKGITWDGKSPLYKDGYFLQAFNNLPFGPNPAHGVFDENIFLHPSLKIYWELPRGWNYANESTAAGAIKDKNQLLVTIAGKDRQLDTLIENFVNGYYAKTRKQPISDKRLKMEGRTGSELILPATQNNQVIYSTWFKKDHFTWVIMGLGDKEQVETFRASVMTFRDITEKDYDRIAAEELLTFQAKGTETCVELAKKAGHVSPKFLSLVNDIAEEKPFQKGDIIKTIGRKRYQPKE